MPYTKNFKWGAATAAFQIEGGWDADGKGPGLWDGAFLPEGAVRGGHTGDTACDHYHLWHQDVQLMRELGLQSYRFSISWPRVLPGGIGALNAAGMDFYDRLIDALLEAGIEPCVTLYHWDLPRALYLRGGWLNPDSPNWFAEYAEKMAKRFSDRVSRWITLNEPQCFIGHGLQTGLHAPFLRLSEADVLTAAHNALLAHGKGVQALRAAARQPLHIGTAMVGCVHMPESDAPAHVEAARQAMFRTDMTSVFNAAWWSDPIFLGRYPADGLDFHAAHMPMIGQTDMEIISQPVDFFGVNIYSGTPAPGIPPIAPPRTQMDWEVRPEALYWGPRFLWERYGKPVCVTENGMANCDWIMQDGQIHDYARIDYLRRYLAALDRAAADGVEVDGYYQWSLLDNFEWALGYERRFGIVHVDYETQKRTPKDSAFWYRDWIAEHNVSGS